MKICFATNNKKKLGEVRAALEGTSFSILSLEEIGCEEEIPETGDTLVHNAFQKARFIKDKYGLDCFADDTGLEVDALEGEPGVYSGRYAGEPRSEDRNIDLLLKNMKDSSIRTARFKTVIALIMNGSEYKFEGVAEGEILMKRQGNGGFGYDSVFRPAGFNQSFAELSMDKKNEISHRGKAVRELIDHLSGTQF